jgi:hypothetical protein
MLLGRVGTRLKAPLHVRAFEIDHELILVVRRDILRRLLAGELIEGAVESGFIFSERALRLLNNLGDGKVA